MEGIISTTGEQVEVAHSAAAESGAGASIELLTFKSLNRRLSAMPDYGALSPNSSRWSRVGGLIALFAYLAALVVPQLGMSGVVQGCLLLVVLVVEVVGLAMNVWFTRREFTSLMAPLDDLAKQLDHDFPHHFGVRSWLMSQPVKRLEQYASMASFRRERYTQRLPLVAGAIPTLGVIPVLIAVYFQGRQLLEGRHLSWIDWSFGLVLLLFYVLTWTSSLAKSRLDAMDMHLQGAFAEVSKGREEFCNAER